MIDTVRPDECIHCGACIDKCPFKCISFTKEYEASYYPEINYDKCTKCELCSKVCPISNRNQKKAEIRECFAAQNLNRVIRANSSSGGLFDLLCKVVLSNNGYVAGVIMDKSLKANHIISNDYDMIKLMYGSKYVMSNLHGIYVECKKKLNEGLPILFSGTPCQVAALRSYLGKDYENLLCVDVVCHGVPSQSIFDKYVTYLENKHKVQVESYYFRDKKNGWKTSSTSIIFDNGKSITNLWVDDLYMYGFLTNVFLNSSCYRCNYKSLSSGSDITLGDLWGANYIVPELEDDLGTSLVIINTHKGKKLIENIADEVNMKQILYKEALKYNRHVEESAINNNNRKEFFDIVHKDINKAFKTFCQEPLYMRALRKIKRNVRKVLRYRAGVKKYENAN